MGKLMSMLPVKLVIFDLDQTLVEVLTVHNETMCRLFLRFYGVKARFTDVDFTGRSLGENITALARLRGVDEVIVQKNLKAMLEAYDRIFVEVMPADGLRYLLPGVIPLLEALRKAGAVLVLYTGDSRAVAQSICRATGLDKYFRQSFYGTEVPARADMVKQAIDWAEKDAGRRFCGKDIIIVGDSLRDIECGRQFDAKTIAVATGYHTDVVLRGAKPDFLFAGLADTQKVLSAIFGNALAI
jgi:phosphoglycolate phosphatase-like HAD superfamily hydrolase